MESQANMKKKNNRIIISLACLGVIGGWTAYFMTNSTIEGLAILGIVIGSIACASFISMVVFIIIISKKEPSRVIIKKVDTNILKESKVINVLHRQQILKLLSIGTSNFILSALIVAVVLYFIYTSGNSAPKWDTALFRLLGFSYFIAGVISANACGKYSRTLYKSVTSSLAVKAFSITFILEVVIWSSFIPIEGLIRSQLSLPPNNQQDFGGIVLYAAICSLSWLIKIK